MRLRLLVLLLLSSFTSAPAGAGQWLSKCQQATKKSNAQCDGAISQAAAAGQAMNSSVSGMIKATNTPGASGPNMNSAPTQSDTGQKAIQAQKDNADRAMKECEGAKQDCSNQCKQQKGEAQPHASNPKDPQYGPAKGDVASIPGVQSGQCEGEIDKKIATVKANSDQLPGAKDQAKDTGKESGQMPQIPPPPPPNEDPKPDPVAASTCTPGADDPSGRCGGTPAAPTVAPLESGQLSFTGAEPKDPAATLKPESKDPATAVRDGKGTGVSSGGGGGGSGGGGSGGGMGSGSMAPASLGSSGGERSGREGPSVGHGSLNVDGGGGGAGGGSSANSGSGEDALYNPRNPPKWGEKEKPLLPAQPVAGSGKSDQSQPHGPSVFYIADQAHGSFCKKRGITKACAK